MSDAIQKFQTLVLVLRGRRQPSYNVKVNFRPTLPIAIKAGGFPGAPWLNSFNQAVCSLRFLYSITLPREWKVERIPFAKRPKRLPLVLSHEEVEAILKCTKNLKHRALLSTLYATGMRLSEATHLKIRDIDSSRMQLRVASGKGQKTRLCAALTAVAGDPAELLESVSVTELPLSRPVPAQALRGHLDPKDAQGLSSQGENPETPHYTAHAAAQLCHGTLGSRGGLVDDQQAARACLVSNDHDLSACAQAASGPQPQSAGLAAGATSASVAGSDQPGLTGSAADIPTVGDLILAGTEPFLKQHPWAACPQVQSTLAKLALCRTHALGGRKYKCDDCGKTSTRYNSCGDRHCPGCSGSKRFDFTRRASGLLLPGVDYYQVVFTLPNELSELALANRMSTARLLSGAAWSSLSSCIRSEQKFEPAALSVLHTWNQRLDAHWHVHLLVPGGGPSLKADHWKTATPPAGSELTEGHYLVDSERLREKYRDRYLTRLERLREQGNLKLDGKFSYLRDADNWRAFIENLRSQQWVAYIQPPPSSQSSAEQVLKYLTRYLTGGPISSARITAADHQQVCFTAREGQVSGGNARQVEVKLSPGEFVRRWCLHIQPCQLTKTRYLGGWSCSHLSQYMGRCKALLAEHRSPADVTQAHSATSSDRPDPQSEPKLLCSHCGSSRLSLLSETPKPSWSELFRPEHRACPAWYRHHLLLEAREFWDTRMGSGFYDWYLEEVLESAETPTDRPGSLSPVHNSPPPQPCQLYFAGFSS